MTPLVSIIIPSYNHAHFLIQTLDSVIADSYPNKEIVIIDDGSKDNSLMIINSWIVLHPEQSVNFMHRANKGLCVTLNELVDRARGKYLVILASDDLLINNTIEERVIFLEKSDKLVIFSDAEVIDEKGSLLYESMLFDMHKANRSRLFEDESLLDHITFNFFISGAVVMMSRDIFKTIDKYQEDLKGEDLFFYISVASRKQLAFYDKKVSRYRIHGNNTSNWENPVLLDAFIETYKRLFFKIPGFKRKMLVLKRLIGITLKKYKFVD